MSIDSNKLLFLSLDEAKKADVPWPDVYFTPQYGSAVEQSDQGTWEVAICLDGPIVYPYIKRDIDPELCGEGLFDIASPYGYAGTWIPQSVPCSLVEDFRKTLRIQLKDRGCIAEFQRLTNLVPGRSALLEADDVIHAWHHNDTVSLDLTTGYETVWEKAAGRSRTAIRKARRLGYAWSCRIASAEDFHEESIFKRLYEQTMLRANATPYYFFSSKYYENLVHQLGEKLHYFEVCNKSQETVAVGLFLEWRGFLHMHLTGACPHASRDGAGNLAYDGLIQWGCEAGKFEKLHIGGGMKPNDRMFKFKKSFGGDRESFWLSKGVLNQMVYENLTESAARKSDFAVDLLRDSPFFPSYRTPKMRVQKAVA